MARREPGEPAAQAVVCISDYDVFFYFSSRGRMRENNDTSSPAEQMKRLHHAVGTGTQQELAEYLGVSQASISDARRRGTIPVEWLGIVARSRNIDPDWILTGQGRPYCEDTIGSYADAYAAQEEVEVRATLRRVPSRMLAEELLRRIAVAEATAFRRGADGNKKQKGNSLL